MIYEFHCLQLKGGPNIREREEEGVGEGEYLETRPLSQGVFVSISRVLYLHESL